MTDNEILSLARSNEIDIAVDLNGELLQCKLIF